MSYCAVHLTTDGRTATCNSGSKNIFGVPVTRNAEEVDCKKCLAKLVAPKPAPSLKMKRERPIRIEATYRSHFNNWCVTAEQGDTLLRAEEVTDGEAMIAEMLKQYPTAKVDRWSC